MKSMNIPSSFNVIPVKDKRPLMDWQVFSKEIQTALQKEEIEKKFPQSQKAIVTGKVSKILVLDDDGGLSKELIIPRTLTQSTPRGGKHYLFKWVPELENKITTKVGILEKVDVRGEGGYVCFYGFDQQPHLTPLASPPKWLIDLLPNRDQIEQPLSTKENSWILNQLESIKPGQGANGRRPTFVRVIGRLKNMGLDQSEVVSFLAPWAVKYELSGYENLVADQYKRYPPIKTNDSQGVSIESFLENQERVEWIVPNIVAKNSIGFVAGLPETGKTWMLIDLAIEVARGGKWLGKYQVKQGNVLFIDQERFKGETQRRFLTVLSGKELKVKDIKNALFVRSGTTTRLNLQRSFDAFKKELSDIRPELVIVDSFATFHTSEENSRQSIQEVLEKIKELRAEFGCTFLFIHHESKMAFQQGTEESEPSISQMAGSVAIPAAAELVFTVRKSGNGESMVYNTKNTLAASVPPFLIRVEDMNDTKTKIQVKAY